MSQDDVKLLADKIDTLATRVGTLETAVTTLMASAARHDQTLRWLRMLGILLLGAAAAYAVLVIGVGCIIQPRTFRDGAGRLLLVISALATVLLTWIAMKEGTLAQWAGVLDQAAPEQRANYMALGHAMESQLDFAFWLHLAVIGLVGIGALAAGGGKVLSGIAHFRISAAVTTLFVIGILVLSFTLSSAMDDLVEQADRNDGTYFVRHNEAFRGAISKTRESGSRGKIPAVIVNPDHIWVDHQRAVPTKGFRASADPGLRTALKTTLDAWEVRFQADGASTRIRQEEIEDWVNQDNQDDASLSKSKRHAGEEGVMGQMDAKRSDNRFGIKGPADNPDPHLARERAKEYAASKGILAVLRGEQNEQAATKGPWAHLLKTPAPPRPVRRVRIPDGRSLLLPPDPIFSYLREVSPHAWREKSRGSTNGSGPGTTSWGTARDGLLGEGENQKKTRR